MPTVAVHRVTLTPVRSRAGGNVIAVAAANAGARIHHAQTGKLYDLTHLRHNVVSDAIVLPAGVPDTAETKRLRQRHVLWNLVQDVHDRLAGAEEPIAHQYECVVPRELIPEQAVELAGWFAEDVAQRYARPVDLTLQRPNDKQKDYVLRLLVPAREVAGLQGLAER